MDAQHEDFLRRQLDEGLALAAASDVLDLVPGPGPLPDRYVARLAADGLVREANGPIEVAHACVVHVWFCRDYLWRHRPELTLTWIAPRAPFHPNLRPLPGGVAMCPGPLRPATGLCDLLTHAHGIWTWDIATLDEFDCLNPAAAQFGRRHRDRIPVDSRPIVWRAARAAEGGR